MPGPHSNPYGNRYAGGGGSGGGGSGTISDITSTGSTITVTNPTGPTTDIEVALVPSTATIVNAPANDVSDASLLYLHQFYR